MVWVWVDVLGRFPSDPGSEIQVQKAFFRSFFRRGVLKGSFFHGWSTNPAGPRTPPRNKGLIAGLIKGNQWKKGPIIRPAISGGGTWPGGVG